MITLITEYKTVCKKSVNKALEILTEKNIEVAKVSQINNKMCGGKVVMFRDKNNKLVANLSVPVLCKLQLNII